MTAGLFDSIIIVGDVMTTEHWIERNTASLAGKRIAVTGPTGGLGRQLCGYIARLGGELVLLDRNAEKSERLRSELRSKYGAVKISRIPLELESVESVRSAAEQLIKEPPDVLILNAGAYSIPRKRCSTGYDNVFQINYASHYLLVKALLPELRKRRGRVVAVGSIAHRYSHTDPRDPDFSRRTSSALVYGNSKRRLMFSLTELFSREREATLSVVHPGITFTDITAHYPPWLFAIIKYPMKLIFMSPRRAALSLLDGIFEQCRGCEWIGPRFFGIWGLPAKRKLNSCPESERREIFAYAEERLPLA